MNVSLVESNIPYKTLSTIVMDENKELKIGVDMRKLSEQDKHSFLAAAR